MISSWLKKHLAAYLLLAFFISWPEQLRPSSALNLLPKIQKKLSKQQISIRMNQAAIGLCFWKLTRAPGMSVCVS